MAFFPENMPVPGGSMDTKPFWEFCKKHELRFQQCTRCYTFRFHPQPVCWRCQSFNFEWVKSRGEGRVYSKVVVHHPAHPATRDVVPYNVVVVEMDDCGQQRVTSNIVDTPNEKIEIGMPVELVWEDINDEVALYRFRPRQAAATG